MSLTAAAAVGEDFARDLTARCERALSLEPLAAWRRVHACRATMRHRDEIDAIELLEDVLEFVRQRFHWIPLGSDSHAGLYAAVSIEGQPGERAIGITGHNRRHDADLKLRRGGDARALPSERR